MLAGDSKGGDTWRLNPAPVAQILGSRPDRGYTNKQVHCSPLVPFESNFRRRREGFSALSYILLRGKYEFQETMDYYGRAVA